MHGFRNWLVENLTGGAPTHYEGQKPHHEYHTEDGHHIQVHVSKNEKGSHAVFINKSLGGHVTKLVHWNVGAEHPSKAELEQLGKGSEEEDAHLKESYLLEAATKKVKEPKEEQHVINGKMTPNTGGKVAEHATMAYLIGHKHAHAGTTGSPEHLAEVKEHEDEIKRITKGVADPKSVETRMEHGRAAANLILQHVKEKHGPDAKIVNVGHTAKPGDIARFTRGVHTNDTQKNNPSDVAVEVSGSRLKPHKKNSDGTHFDGYSLKSSEKAAEITANNPAIHLHGMLDTANRKLGTEKVSRDSLKKHVHEPLGGAGKSATQRGAEIKAKRLETGESKTELEHKASEGGRKAIDNVTSEFHKHLQHLTTKEGDAGHHLIGNMLKQHLVADSDMPWAKVKSKGDQKEKVKASLTGGSESPLKKILNDKNTKFSAIRKPGSPTVHVGYLHPETGEHVTLAKYTPKTKSNAYKSDVHGWNVVPASHH